MESTFLADDTVVETPPTALEQASVSEFLTRQSIEIELKNDLNSVASAVQALARGCWWDHEMSQGERDGMTVALEEAITNAIVHGNLEVSSALREAADGAYERLIRLRRGKRPYSSRRVHVGCEVTRDAAIFAIRDDGRGFDAMNLPDPRDPERLTLASGRGILLMRAFMDVVQHNPTGNAVTMVKQRPRPRSPATLPAKDAR